MEINLENLQNITSTELALVAFKQHEKTILDKIDQLQSERDLIAEKAKIEIKEKLQVIVDKYEPKLKKLQKILTKLNKNLYVFGKTRIGSTYGDYEICMYDLKDSFTIDKNKWIKMSIEEKREIAESFNSNVMQDFKWAILDCYFPEYRSSNFECRSHREEFDEIDDKVSELKKSINDKEKLKFIENFTANMTLYKINNNPELSKLFSGVKLLN